VAVGPLSRGSIHRVYPRASLQTIAVNANKEALSKSRSPLYHGLVADTRSWGRRGTWLERKAQPGPLSGAGLGR